MGYSVRRQRRIDRSSRAGLLIVTATACILLTACTGQAQASVTVPVPAKDVATWKMPLDDYIPVNADDAQYAEDLLIEPCMNKAGYSWPVPWQLTSVTPSPSLNIVGRRLFNVQLAQQWGYHDAKASPAEEQSKAAMRAFSESVSHLSAAELAAFRTCVPAAEKQLPVLPISAQTAAKLGEQAYRAALTSDLVLSDAKKWRTCMAAAGVWASRTYRPRCRQHR